MDEEESSRVYVGKAREPYSGMVLNSIFRLLSRSIVLIVIVGIVLMLIPILL
jgi:hypothetical protein